MSKTIDIKEFEVLNELKEEDLSHTKLLYVFKDYLSENNVLIVTNDDKVSVFGNNYKGVLGFGNKNKNKVIKLTHNEELSHKQIIDLKNGSQHVIARTFDGKVYCWGCNESGVLGNRKKDCNIYKPELNQYLSDKQIIDICCGGCHSLVLTNSGEVYAWGLNSSGQIGNERGGENECQLIPIKVNGFNKEKIVMISCGDWYSMALTESGRVFSWGSNRSGQLGHNNNKEFISKPTIVSLYDKISIKKISCGQSHSLLLSRDEHIYWFGWNGIDDKSIKQMTPKKLINTNKFIDIASHYNKHISIALSVKDIYYIWGNCGEIEKIKEPEVTEFKSFDDVFNHYFGITYKILNLCNKEQNKKENIDKNQIRLEENGEKVKANKTETSQPDENLPRYKSEFKQLELLGSGSFGEIYKVFNHLDRQQYAIKIIKIEGNSDEQEDKRLREIRVMAKLQSDHTIQYNTSWIENKDTLYIQMQLCFNNLSKIIEQKENEFKRKESEAMTPSEYYISSELFKEILESVQYLHKQNIIHRDLKPENILITDGLSGRFVKLCDFGLAVIHEFETQTHTKDKGTPKYTAPEVMDGRSYDTKADIYSLGFVAKQLFDVDIYDSSNVTINNSLLENKYKTIIEAIKNMMSVMKTSRPTCDKLLTTKKLWSLEISDIENELICQELVKITINELSIEENFCKYFIKTKIQ